jgi:hypothetical protein
LVSATEHTEATSARPPDWPATEERRFLVRMRQRTSVFVGTFAGQTEVASAIGVLGG